jgi:hypothetical protein
MVFERSTNKANTIPDHQINNYMTKILHLLRFTDDRPSKPGAEIGSDASENKRCLRRVVVIPFRSPNDQQQVFAIRTFYIDEKAMVTL